MPSDVPVFAQALVGLGDRAPGDTQFSSQDPRGRQPAPDRQAAIRYRESKVSR